MKSKKELIGNILELAELEDEGHRVQMISVFELLKYGENLLISRLLHLRYSFLATG